MDDSVIGSLAKQASISFVGQVVTRIIGFGFLLTITRLVDPSVFGTFTLAMSVISIVQLTSSLSIHRSVDYFIPQFLSNEEYGKARGYLRNAFLLSTFVGLGVGILIFFFAGQFSSIFDNAELRIAFLFLAVTIPLWIISQLIGRTFIANKQVQYNVFVQNIVQPAGKFALTAIFLLIGFDLLALLLGHVVALVLTLATGATLLVKKISWLKFEKIESHPPLEMIGYSAPLIFSGVLGPIIRQMDYILIGHYMSAALVGQYRIGHQLTALVILPLISIQMIFKPYISENIDDITKIKSRYRTVTRWGILLSLPIGLTLFLAPGIYLRTLFTQKYTVAAIIPVLIIGQCGAFVVGPAGKVLLSLGYSRLTLINTAIEMGINLILGILLIPRIGILGAAVATAIALVIGYCLSLVEIYYLHNLHPASLNMFKTLLAGIPAGISGYGVAYWIQQDLLVFALLPVVVSGTYLLALIAMKGFTQGDEEIAATIDDYVGYPLVNPIVTLRK